MSDNSSPHERTAVAEPPPPSRSAPSWSRPVLLTAIVAAVLVLMANIWLVSRLVQQQANETQEHFFWILCQPGFTPTERARAFTRLVAAGNREWRSAELSDLDLRGISLPEVDLTRAGFNRVNLAKAVLARAIINRATFTLCDLTEADLSEADLSETRCYRAVLIGAMLRRVNARAAVLQEVKAERADFKMADLSDADCLMADLTGADFSGANLSNTRLEGAILRDTNLALTRLENTNLKDADFTDSNWWRARGLTTAQLDILKKKFVPSENAPAALKADYQKWAGGNGG
jgi:uncharacterized protein YjbI with pentapeptide repeats